MAAAQVRKYIQLLTIAGLLENTTTSKTIMNQLKTISIIDSSKIQYKNQINNKLK